MSVLLDSPLEALAFNYVSFGIFTIVNNMWTWVAVITAAVSFRMIRTAGAAVISSYSVVNPELKPSTCIINSAQDVSGSTREAEDNPTSSAEASAPSPVWSPFVCTDISVTKGGKFRLTYCYEDEGENDVDGEITSTERNNGDDYREGEISCGEWWESWERVLSLKKGETGWYRHQDLTVINGNVVRLWDECRRGSCNSSCAVW